MQLTSEPLRTMFFVTIFQVSADEGMGKESKLVEF